MEFFLDWKQECILMYFGYDTVSAMDTCAAQQSTWHLGKRDRFRKTIVFLYVPCLAPHIKTSFTKTMYAVTP